MIRNTALSIVALALLTACNRSSEPPRSDAGTPAPAPTAAGESQSAPAPASTAADADASASAGASNGGATDGTATAAGASADGAAGAAGGPGAAGGVTAPGSAAAAPSGPIPVPVTAAIALVGDTLTPVVFDRPSMVDPAVRFQVDVAVPLIDARLALVDSGDAMVAAAESHEIGSSWSRFTLVPEAPLRPGSTYSLRLDGAADREAHDADGRVYQITAWEIRTTGELPPPEKPAAKPKRRR